MRDFGIVDPRWRHKSKRRDLTGRAEASDSGFIPCYSYLCQQREIFARKIGIEKSYISPWNKRLSQWEWRKVFYGELATFVNDDAKCFITPRRNLLDVRASEGRIGLIRALYEDMRNCSIQYDLALFSHSKPIQIVRTPNQVLLQPKQGTCLDLSLAFSSILMGNRLLPVVVVFQDHAMVLVSLKEDRDVGTSQVRFKSKIFFDPDGIKDRRSLLELLEEGYYVGVECTGFAQSTALSENRPEGIGRIDGLLTFDRAVAAAQEQFECKERIFDFAIDICAFQELYGMRSLPIETGLANTSAIIEVRDRTKSKFGDFQKLNIEPNIKIISNQRILATPWITGKLSHSLRPNISDLYKSLGKRGSLLILGGAGSGKTFLMLTLVSTLLREQAEIPVVIEIGSYRGETDFERWLKETIAKQYALPRPPVNEWFGKSNSCLILDGFEEIRDEFRCKMLDAVNQLAQEQNFGIILVSRLKEFMETRKSLNFGAAVYVQSLSINELQNVIQGQANGLTSLIDIVRGKEPGCAYRPVPSEYLDQLCDLGRRTSELSDYKHFFGQIQWNVSLTDDHIAEVVLNIQERINGLDRLAKAVSSDREVYNAAKLPILLDIILAETVKNPSLSWLNEGTESGDSLQSRIWRLFLNESLGATSEAQDFKFNDMRRWLGWLALSMRRLETNSFSMDHLQPGLLTRLATKMIYYFAVFAAITTGSFFCMSLLGFQSWEAASMLGIVCSASSLAIVMPCPMRVRKSLTYLYWSLGWLQKYVQKIQRYSRDNLWIFGKKTRFIILGMVALYLGGSTAIAALIIFTDPKTAPWLAIVGVFLSCLAILLWLGYALYLGSLNVIYFFLPFIYAINTLGVSVTFSVFRFVMKSRTTEPSFDQRIFLTFLNAVLLGTVTSLLCNVFTHYKPVISVVSATAFCFFGILPIVQYVILRVLIIADGGPASLSKMLEQACSKRVLVKTLAKSYHFPSKLLAEHLAGSTVLR